ncbi:hypothetical protein ACSI5F_03670 [Ralstonia pseudosolanacearum]|uniref:hypothetical protein n=1 Tax=Ralstonia pseudosolanacearum TaxID=1310165 RepID=UPI003EE09B3E
MDKKSEQRLTERGHRHVEAFCLMHYACKCGHHEVIWNSRDGVTAFTAPCPSCGDAMGMQHVAFRSDVYAPEHKPHHGQRVWVDITYNRAEEFAKKRIAAMKEQGLTRYVNVADVATSIYHEGMAPDLRVHGYDFEYGKV